jgi:hypothetical protein
VNWHLAHRLSIFGALAVVADNTEESDLVLASHIVKRELTYLILPHA